MNAMKFDDSIPDLICKLQGRARPIPFRRSFPFCMTQSRAALALSESPVWFCLKAQPKHEHIAGMNLRRQMDVPCFSPRVRFRKATKRGAVWFVEAMFPGYLFAQFVYPKQHRQVQHLPGVQGIVQFGDYVATLDDLTIDALRQHAGEDAIVPIDTSLKVGQAVEITEGPMRGLEAVVTQVLPAKERIRVLLELLGGTIEAEIATPSVLPVRGSR
jgi:transcriptional antiterminator RfaH